MGLDNGIRLRRKDDKEVETPFGEELCYWRKCWGLRNAIVAKLHLNKEGGYSILQKEDIVAIARIIIHFIDKDIWEEEGDSIWDYEEDDMREKLINNIIAIYRALDWLDNQADKEKYELQFYDSW